MIYKVLRTDRPPVVLKNSVFRKFHPAGRVEIFTINVVSGVYTVLKMVR